MAAFRIRFLEVLTVVFWIFPLHVSALASRGAQDRSGMTAIEACMEFASSGPNVSWTLAECMDVWSAWARSVPDWLHLNYSDRRLMKEVAVEMRQRGQPCVVQPQVRADGVGSEVTRHLAAWLYAAEIGCDLITPNFGYDEGSEDGLESGTLYCHPSVDEAELESAQKGGFIGEQNLESCELVNWLLYFHLELPSVPEPEATFRNITVCMCVLLSFYPSTFSTRSVRSDYPIVRIYTSSAVTKLRYRETAASILLCSERSRQRNAIISYCIGQVRHTHSTR